MSKLNQNKSKNQKANLVGDLNEKKLQQTKKNFSNTNMQQNTFYKFCKDFLEKDFSKLKSEFLKKIYEDGVELLNTYYITDSKDKIEMSIVQQTQFIIMKINSELSNRQLKELIKQNKELNKELSETMQKAEKLEEQTKSDKVEIKHIKNDMKSITTTIISIILTISIIPTAIVGIEKINAEYILPFVSSIILFGMIMMIFVYSIYQDRIKKSTWIILTISLIITLILWYMSISNIMDISKEENKNTNTNTIEEVPEPIQEELAN